MKKVLSKLTGWLYKGDRKPSQSFSLNKSVAAAKDGLQAPAAAISRNPMNSVGMKLFLIFFLCILLFVIVMGTSSYEISKSVIEKKVAAASLETIDQLGQKQDLMFDQYEGMTLQFLVDTDLQSFIGDMNNDSISAYDRLQSVQKITSKLNGYLNANKNLKAIHLYKADGEKITSVGSGNGAVNAADQEWFKKAVAAAGKAVWLDTQPKGYSDQAAAFGLARLLKSTSYNGPATVLLMEIKEESLSTEYQQISMGQSGKFYMLNGQNQYIASTNREEISTEAPLKLTDEQMKEQDGQTTVDFNGDRTLVVYNKSPKTGWFTVAEVKVSELTKEMNTISKMTTWMSLIAIVLAVAIGYMVVRMIGRPLAILRNLMKLGEQGDLRGRTHFRSKDEIGELGRSFNQMMDQITMLVTQTNQSASEVLATAAELSDSSKKTATSAKEIAIATEEIAGGATSLAIESEKGNELTHHIAEQMKKVVEANGKMGASAEEVQHSSRQGANYMSELTVKTNATEQMTRSMVDKVDKLKESTRSIRKILVMLNTMTKQTNILSLNATIEAARAGAAGKGFMVVADEIRKLADQSRQSIEVVGQITENIQNEIDETVETLSVAYPMFQEQIASVKETDGIFRQVQQNMDVFITKLSEASESIRQLDESQLVLSDAMSNVSAVAEQSSATSEEVASLSSEQLNISDTLVGLSDKLESLSNSLKESLARFKV